MSSDVQKELAASVSYFEQILNVLPGDRTALEFLCVAYEQLGDAEKHLKHALALAAELVKEKDAASAKELVQKLEEFDRPEAKAAVLKLQALSAPVVEIVPEEVVPAESAVSVEAAVKAEKALLNMLSKSGVLDDAAVQTVLAVLANPTAEDDGILISALSILEKENVGGAEQSCAAVADAAHAPPIPLNSFEIPPDGVRLLPETLVRSRGVVPFAKVGKDWAVALANPCDEALKSVVSELMGAKCHFFLAMPSSIAPALERVFRSSEKEDEGALPPVVKPAFKK